VGSGGGVGGIAGIGAGGGEERAAEAGTGPSEAVLDNGMRSAES